jgi:hypothetical protein
MVSESELEEARERVGNTLVDRLEGLDEVGTASKKSDVRIHLELLKRPADDMEAKAYIEDLFNQTEPYAYNGNKYGVSVEYVSAVGLDFSVSFTVYVEDYDI